MTHPLPQNWQTVKLRDIPVEKGLVRGPFGGALKKEFFVKEGYKVYEQKNAIYGTYKLGDYYVTEEKFSELKRFEVVPGDFIISCSGTIGKIYQIPKGAPKGLINQALLKIRVNTQIINDKYFFYYFGWRRFQSEVIDNTQGGAMQNLVGMDVFKNVLFNLPPLPEQHRIVSVLETWDKAIEKLERKIELKKNVKKGLMQQLLTGKKRLPGFSGEWEVMKLGDVCKIKTGKRDNKDKVENGQYPFFVRSPNVERIDTYSYEGEAILVPGEGNIGSIFHYINGRFDVHQRVYKISAFKESVFGKYIYYYLFQYFGKHALKSSVKATVDSLRLPMFTEFTIKIPAKDEQEAIANIISSANQEIELLHAKLQKLKDQKTYLLNSLITGRIRIPETMSLPS